MLNYGEKAAELFSQGYNCAQSVVGAFAEHFGMDTDTLLRLASPFGGGLAGTRGTCGAVSGMVMVAGLISGYSEAGASSKKQAVYALAREMMEEFEKENGSVICSELLARQREGTEKKKPCGELCAIAADIAAKYL